MSQRALQLANGVGGETIFKTQDFPSGMTKPSWPGDSSEFPSLRQKRRPVMLDPDLRFNPGEVGSGGLLEPTRCDGGKRARKGD